MSLTESIRPTKRPRKESNVPNEQGTPLLDHIFIAESLTTKKTGGKKVIPILQSFISLYCYPDHSELPRVPST